MRCFEENNRGSAAGQYVFLGRSKIFPVRVSDAFIASTLLVRKDIQPVTDYYSSNLQLAANEDV